MRMRTAAFILAVGILGAPAALAGVVFPPEPMERGQTVKLVYRLAEPVSGTGRLDLEWRDVAGRLVESRRLTMPLDHASEFAFPLDLRRAVAIKNSLHTHLSLSGVDGAGTAYRREEDENHSFIVRAPDPTWSDYRIIMWQPQSASRYAALKRLGVDAAAVEAIHDASPAGEPGRRD